MTEAAAVHAPQSSEVVAAPLRSSVSLDFDNADGLTDDNSAQPQPAPYWDATAHHPALETPVALLDSSLPTQQLSASMPVGTRFSSSMTPSSHALQQHHATADAASHGSLDSPASASASLSFPHHAVLPVRSSTMLTAAPVLVALLKERYKRTGLPRSARGSTHHHNNRRLLNGGHVTNSS